MARFMIAWFSSKWGNQHAGQPYVSSRNHRQRHTRAHMHIASRTGDLSIQEFGSHRQNG
jgi:hypothetical protein